MKFGGVSSEVYWKGAREAAGKAGIRLRVLDIRIFRFEVLGRFS